MSTYQITCASKVHAHRHIVTVGTPQGVFNVATARSMIARGDRFYTVSPSTRKTANVERYTCSCGVETLKSAPDAVRDNNLDNLRDC